MIEITDQDLEIMMQATKTLLFENTKPRFKKSGIKVFDVPMGCYDGAEVCGVAVSYMLKQLKYAVNKESIGFY